MLEFKHSKRINLKRIRKAIADGADVNAINEYGFGGRTPLDWAIRVQIGALEAFFRKHGGKTYRELKGPEPPTADWLRAEESIHRAAAAGHIEAVKQHLDAGEDVNAKMKDGTTPLYLAASRDRKEVAELLIAEGADVNAKVDNRGTPLDAAILSGATGIEALLRKHGGKTKNPERRRRW